MVIYYFTYPCLLYKLHSFNIEKEDNTYTKNKALLFQKVMKKIKWIIKQHSWS